MSTQYEGNPANDPQTVTLPSDGDEGLAASVNDGLQDLADIAARIPRRAAVLNWFEGEIDVHNFFVGPIFPATADGGNTPESAWVGLGGATGTAPTVFVSINGGRTKFLQPPTGGAAKNFEMFDGVYDASLGLAILVGDADGTDAYILTSPTLNLSATWTERAPSVSKNLALNGIATDGAGVLVAAGVHDGVDIYALRSTDGIVWTEVVMAGVAGDAIRKITHDGTSYVAVGVASGGGPLIKTSLDGIVWSPRTPGVGATGALNDVTYNGTALVAVGDDGEVHQSLDGGLTWVLTRNPGASPDDRDLRSVASHPALKAIVATQEFHGLLFSLDNGVTWERIVDPPFTGQQGTGFDIVGAGPSGFMLYGGLPLFQDKVFIRSQQV